MSGAMWDLAHGGRRLWRTRATSGLAVAALALGIGLDSALFAAVDAVLLRALPFADEQRLVFVTETDAARGAAHRPVSYPDYVDLAREAKTLQAVAAMPNTLSEALTLATASGPVRLTGAAVSHGFFEVLGVTPAIGESFRAEHDVTGAERTLVLADATWRSQFGADPGLVGRSVSLSGESHRVLGIAPPGFEYPKGADLWTPLVPAQPAYLEARGTGWLHLVARLAPGATVATADAELDAIVGRLAALDAAGGTDARSAVVTPLRAHLVGEAGTALILLAAAVFLVLLIACANVASLLVAQGLARRRELAVRTALGASRGRLVRLLLVETLVVAALGAGLGLGLAHVSLGALVGLAPGDVPGLVQAAIDGRVIAFALALSLVTALLAGLWPALAATREAPVDGLRGSSRGSSSEARAVRARRLLVGLEAAFAVVVLALASLVVKSFVRLADQDLGYRPEQALTAHVGPDRWRHPKPEDKRRFHRELLARLRTVPGVSAAGATLLRPLELGAVGIDGWYLLPSQAPAAIQENPIVNYVAWSVAARRRELAVRLALGAGRADVLSLVLRDGLLPIAGGLSFGLAAAAALAQVARSLLFEVAAVDPASYATATAALLLAALAACLPPALRASRVDPAEALQAE